MRRTFVPLLCAALLSPVSFAQTPRADVTPVLPTSGTADRRAAQPLTLEAALDSAMQLNPQLRAAELELEASEGTVQQASTLLNPTLGIEQEDTRQDYRSTTVQISQTLETGGKRAARIGLAHRVRELAQADLVSRRVDVRATITQTFFDALIAQERVKVTEESLRIAASGASAAARRVIAGKVSPTEETRARVAEANARIELRQAQAERQSALHALAAAIGLPDGAVSELDGRPEALPVPPAASTLAQRLADAPALRRAELEVERAQASYELERTRRYPDVTVSLGAKRSEELGRNQLVLGVAVPLPLFDRNQGAQLETLRRRDAARAQAEAEALRLRAEVLQGRDRLQARTDEVVALQAEVLPGARSAYEAASRGFELGKFGFLDVLDAQRTWLQARSQYLNALAQAHREAAELERRLGIAIGSPRAGNQP